MTLQPSRVDEPSGRVIGWVGEDGTGVLPAGLVLAPPPNDLGDGGLRLLAISRSERELAPHHDVVRCDRGVPVRVGEAGYIGVAVGVPAAEVDETEPPQ